jgi:hypothetical protein
MGCPARHPPPGDDAVSYHVQKLDGYTDGRPSWTKISWARTKEQAIIERLRLEARYPLFKFRVRKVPKRK